MTYKPHHQTLVDQITAIPILRSFMKDELIDTSKLLFDKDGRYYYLNLPLHKLKVLIDVDYNLREYLFKLKNKYSNAKISLRVEPYHLILKAGTLIGPTLRQIFNQGLYKKKRPTYSTYLIIDDYDGSEIAKIEFKFEPRDKEYIIQMELLRNGFPTSRYIHCILNKDKQIIHLDGYKFYYENEYDKRLQNKYLFEKETKRDKIFKINGEVHKKELIPIVKLFFEMYCKKYLKMQKL